MSIFREKLYKFLSHCIAHYKMMWCNSWWYNYGCIVMVVCHWDFAENKTLENKNNAKMNLTHFKNSDNKCMKHYKGLQNVPWKWFNVNFQGRVFHEIIYL